MDGVETLQHIAKTHGQGATKILAATASVFDHQRQGFLDSGFDGFIDKPLRANQIYASLAEHLGVEYIYKTEEVNVEGDPKSKNPEDWRDAQIPSDLYKKIASAVETHSITELRAHIQTLEALGPKEKALATYLHDLSQLFEMTESGEVLEAIKKI